MYCNLKANLCLDVYHTLHYNNKGCCILYKGCCPPGVWSCRTTSSPSEAPDTLHNWLPFNQQQHHRWTLCHWDQYIIIWNIYCSIKLLSCFGMFIMIFWLFFLCRMYFCIYLKCICVFVKCLFVYLPILYLCICIVLYIVAAGFALEVSMPIDEAASAHWVHNHICLGTIAMSNRSGTV